LKEAEAAEPGIIELILSGKCGDTDLDRLYALRRQITQEHIPRESDYSKIHPPGRNIWIYRSMVNPEKYAFYNVLNRARVFGEVLFDDNMLQHHQPDSYDLILEQI
ncbi:hypothetical protein HDU91_002007, partial [Kappamyces sp. JEL0680]